MTLFGTFTATLVMFVFLLGAGVYGWNAVTQTKVEVPDPTTIGGTMEQVSTHFPSWIFLSLLVAFGLAMVTIFKPKLARITGLLYAVAEGIALGAISHAFNLQYNGIVLQAVLATMAVFASVLFLYATRIVRVTKRFTRIILGAMLGIVVLYLGSAIAHLFGVNIDFYNQPTPARHRHQPADRRGRRLLADDRLRLHRVGRGRRGAPLHGVVRGVRPDGRPRLALPRDPAPPRPAPRPLIDPPAGWAHLGLRRSPAEVSVGRAGAPVPGRWRPGRGSGPTTRR